MTILVEDVSLVRHSRKIGVILVCDKLSLHVEDNELICVVGPSGCGKTTLLHALAGLVKVHRGTISINGEALTGPGAERSLIFQQPRLLPWCTVWKNVLFSVEANRAATEQDKKRASELIEQMDLTAFAMAYPRELSGGMQQRVNIARALLRGPDVLLLDEPFSALDAQTREVQQVEFQRVLVASPTTAVFITHDIDEAVLLADRVIVLTPRPARVIGEVKIECPGPRTVESKEEPWFRAVCREVRGMLKSGSDHSGAGIGTDEAERLMPRAGAGSTGLAVAGGDDVLGRRGSVRSSEAPPRSRDEKAVASGPPPRGGEAGGWTV